MAIDFIFNKMNDLLTREQLGKMCEEFYEENKKLEKKIEELEGWKARSERYEEHQIPETKAIVIKDKTNGRFYCSVCFEKNKSIMPLQPYGFQSSCPSCQAQYKTRPYPEENLRQDDLQHYGITD